MNSNIDLVNNTNHIDEQCCSIIPIECILILK